MRTHGILALILAAGSWLSARPAAGSPPERTLVIMLDGVGFRDFEKLQRQGHFSYLHQAGKLVAPFPTLTNPALAAMTRPLGTAAAAGYEDYYFDPDLNRMRGGVLDRMSPGFSRASYRGVFDFHPPGYLSALEYLAPPWSCRWMSALDLSLGLRKFRRSGKERFLLYLGATDCVNHMGGAGSTLGFLKKLDGRLSRLMEQRPGLRIVLVSDHGNEPSEYRRVRIGRALKRAGYRMESRLRSDRSVVHPAFGLVGVAVLFTKPNQAKSVAQAVASQEGVHFAAVRQADTVFLYGRGEPARILREGNLIRYSPGSADPLQLGGESAKTLAEWFEATKDHVYPLAVHRIWEEADGLVRNRATVVVNLERKGYAGSRWLDFFVKLKATHGGLSDSQSNGFVADSHGPVPDVVTAAQVGLMLAGGPLEPTP